MRVLFIIIIAAMLITNIVSNPPNLASSRAYRMPFRPPVQLQDTTRSAKLDSLNKSAETLEQVFDEATKEVGTLKRNTSKLLSEVKKDRDPEPQIVVIEKQPDTVKDTTCVYLRDSVYSSLPFWKKHKILLQQCNIKQKVKGWFKRKK